MKYHTYTPASYLSNFIKCFWSLHSPSAKALECQTIVPDGCIEMIFHFGDPYRQYISKEKSLIQPKYFVIGQLTKPLVIQPTGKTDIFAIRFRCEGFSPFLKSHTFKDLENTATPLNAIYGNEGSILIANMLRSYSIQHRMVTVSSFLGKMLSEDSPSDRVIKDTVESILNLKGSSSIHELSQNHNIHRRQLERKFSEKIGLSPKYLSKIVRLHAAINLLLDGNNWNLTTVAYKVGYYDQAHFVKDFKMFTGYSPKEFYKDNLQLSSTFYSVD